jgi:Signal transduction histidine kinase
VEIDHQIEQALDQLHFLAEEKKLALTFEKPAEPLPAVLADTDRITEVLINLIGNAIKYTPQGAVTVKTLLDLHGKFVKIEISDTGLGMSKQEQAHLFEKFYRISSPQTTGIMGTGLGLYITKSMVEKMGGSIDVESVPGKGSTFSFILPVFQVQSTPKAHAAS